LEDLGGELREVGDGSVSSEHDVKGYFFSVFVKMESISLMKLVEKIVRLPILSHISR